MAKNESTAINALIEQVAIGRPAPRFDEELMFVPPKAVKKVSPPRISGTVPPMHGAGEVAPLPRSRTPNGTQRHVPQLAGRDPVRMSSLPSRARSIPPLPVASESMMKAFPTPPPAFSPSSLPLQSPPSTPPGKMLPIADASCDAPTYLPPGTSDAWFVTSQNATTEHHRDSLTVQVQRPQRRASTMRKLAGPLLMLVVAGGIVGGYFALDAQRDAPSSAAGVGAQPAPALAAAAKPDLVATPEIAEVAEATSPVAFVDVRIDSSPTGATVMLVDHGKTTFLGTTPLDAALDPSRKYDLVFTHGDRPTRVESIDPAAQKRVAVVLAAPATGTPTAVVPPTEAVTAKVEAKDDAKAEAAARRRAERRAARKARAALGGGAAEVVEQPAKPAPAGEGTLMISSKPPCEIYIDGKATGLSTPQRSIALAVGKHKITLVNVAENIKKTIAVEITADQPTKVIQDLMQ